MIDYYDYQLFYECHLHENTFENKIHALELREKQLRILGESSELEAINEAFLDNVMEYIRKVVASMGEAFNRFQATIKTLNASQVIEKNQKLLQGNLQMQPPADFQMPKYDDIMKFCQKQINQNFTKETLQYLDNEGEYIAQYFDREYSPTNDKSLQDLINEKLYTKTTGKEVIESRQVQQYVNFCTRDFERISNSIANNRKIIDGSSRSVDNALKQMGITESMSYFYEADGDQGGTNNPQPTTQTSNGNNAQQNTQNNNNQNNNQQDDTSKFRVVNNGDGSAIDRKDLANKIKKFYQYNTKILSSQMSVANKAYRQYFTLIRTFIKFQGGQVDLNKENNQNNNQQNQNNNNQG